MFEAESLLRATGEVVPDPQAFAGQAVAAWEGTHPGAHLLYGPYRLFVPGTYRVYYRLKAEKAGYFKPVAEVDVAADQGAQVLASRTVRGWDFEAPSRYQDFDLEFQLRRPARLEFRVRFLGRGRLWVDRVTVWGLHQQDARSPYPTKGVIVFQSSRDGRKAIYRMNPDGSQQVRLTRMDADAEFPRISPDGRWVAFHANPGGNTDIYIVGIEGGVPRRLTRHPAFDGEPAWAPDGRTLYFVSDRDGDFRRIYRLPLDGGVPEPVTRNTRGLYGSPAVSPDGRWLVAASDLYVNWQIHVMDVTGNREQRLTGYAESSCVPSWSPDGRWIFYSSRFGGLGKANLWRMRPDGKEKQPLTRTPFNDYYGVYSPDGKWVVFASDQDGDYEIFVMKADGTERVQLTFNAVEDTMPHWR